MQCGDDDDANVAFHFNPRFGKGVVVRNNKVDNKWNKEQRETDLDGDFPFEANCFFQVKFNRVLCIRVMYTDHRGYGTDARRLLDASEDAYSLVLFS